MALSPAIALLGDATGVHGTINRRRGDG